MRGAASRWVLAALLLLALLPWRAQARELEQAYRDAAASFHRLREEKRADPAPWRSVAEAFLAINRRKPDSRRGADALYSAALCYREAGKAAGDWKDLSRAVATFRKFVADYPADRLADDALMHLAALQAGGYGDWDAAARTYRQVLADYPRGDQVPVATRELAALSARIEAQAGKPRPQRQNEGRPAQMPHREPGPVARSSRNGSAGAPAPRGLMIRVQYWSALEWTRVILTTDFPVRYRYEHLPAHQNRPERLYFDLQDALPAVELPARTVVRDQVLEQIRVNRFDQKTTRVVLDLREMDSFEVRDFQFPGEKKVVIDLRSRTAPEETARRPPALNGSAALPQRRALRDGSSPDPAPRKPELSLKSSPGLKVKAIMLDPGHGGRDPGAIGFGLREKDLALKIALRLRRLLRDRHPRLRVGMTRERDRFISLQKRPRLAREFAADLFVSIHTNANSIERFHGVETYFLNLTRDVSALRVAARENASTEKKIGDLNEILRDLLRDNNIVESSALAKTMQTSLVDTLRRPHRFIRDLGVKQAPFLVLMGAEMPGILVEVGFITNRRENRRMRNPEYRQGIAEGIYEGLRRFIQPGQVVERDSPTLPVALIGNS